MTDLDKAIATQLANIEKRTGKSLAQLTKVVKTSAKHCSPCCRACSHQQLRHERSNSRCGKQTC